MGALVAGLLGAALFLGAQEARRARMVGQGTPAPAFTLARYGGGTVSLAEQKGKVVMLDFWATWCPPCVEEMPYLVKLAGEFEAKGLVFIAANSDDPGEAPLAVEAFVGQRVPGLARYAAFTNSQTSEGFRVNSLPTLYFIDRAGKIIEGEAGLASESSVRRAIVRALESQ